ncbi:HEAT repeat containing protein [Theileria orientalis]|uniref:HEAT repeat containing protein n=1 Tax=Theileria orientalis TaxID=68886 RepID=A0A976SL17_THEOR|nr:HEAT repeat containing protein [Theileria orientalis]
MSSLSKQLSSLRDDRNKNLKRFISDYKSNFKRNNIEVSKSWNSILSFDNQFDEFEILFSEIVHGSSLLSLDKDINKTDDFDIKNIIFDEHKDIDFLTSEELDHLNTIIRRFIEHSVPYFLCTECQHLIDYLIYKYNIAVSFSEYLIVAYIQYNYSEYYCKLLSLFTIRNDSNFHSFYNDMKNFSNNFSNHKYVSSNVVYSGIATNFTLYKQISSCYDRISRMCTNNYNIISFLSTVNIHFVIVNCKVMDNNEIRYVVNMLKDALCHLDSNDYICSYLCLMITVFTHIQLSVAVQREIISSLKPILYNLRDLEVLKIDHLLFFKYILMSIQLMLQYQNQTLDKLPQEITNSLIYILQKHKSTNIVFKTFNQINGFDFSRTINVTLNSLISSTLGNVDILSEFLVLQDDYNILAMENLYFFLNFVNESFNSLSMRMVLFNLIDEVNRISSHFRSHGDTIIEFDVINMLVHINNKHKFSSRLIIIYSIFKLIKKINPTLLEHTIIDYVNRLTYEMLQDQIEVIMFMYRSLSKDIVFRMFTLLNKYSESTSVNKLNDKALFNRNGSIGLILNASSCINDKNSKFYKDDKLFGSLVEFIISISTNTESHTNDLNHLLFNFIINSMNDEDLSNKLESHDRFWKSVPVKTATDSLVCYIQSLIYRLDLGFKYDSNDKLILDSIDHNALAMKDYKFIFNPYINHISKSKELFRIFKIYELILMINNESTVYNTDANINKSLSRFIMFLKTLYQNKNNDYNSENEILLEQNNNSYNEYLIDEKELIELNNDLINRLSKITSIINNDISDENDNYSHYSLYHFGYFSNSNYIILNIFSSLYLQYETLEYISKNDLCSELLHTQFVITSDLILKYVKNKAETKYIKDFVLDFYTFAILKYESIILIKSDTLNEIITIKRFETLLSNKPLNTHFINILPQLFSTTNCELNNINTQIEFINNIFDLLRINNNSNFNWSFSIGFSTDINGNIKYNINKPFNYKHKYFNVDIIKIINDNNISHILSNSSNNINSINPYNNNFIKDSPNIRTNQIISLFDTFDEDVVDKCVESVLTIFKINNNQSSSNLFLSILINAIDLLFDVTFKYSNKISIMLLELSKLCKYHVVKFSELEMTISDIENNKYGCILKLKSDINCDLNNFVNSILLKSNKPEITEHLSSIITDFLIKDNDFFNLFISILFLSSNTIFQINCYKQIFSTIFTCDHKLDFLFSLLDGMTNHMYALLSDENKDIKLFLITFVDLFTRFFLLLYFLSKFKKLINIDNLVIYAENCTHLLNMCTIFKSITRDINKNYQDSNEYNIEISEINHFVNNALIMFDNITFVLLYSLNKGWIWMLPAHYRNTLYSSFVSSFNHFNSYYNITLIKHMFDITNVDDKLFIGFIDDMLYKSYREDVFIHIINNIKSIKTHHVIIYIVKSNRNIDIGLKINLVCKIINNVLISADMENMDVQLLFNNLNNIIDVYLNIISDNKYEHIFLKTIDSNIENILKSFNMNIENEIEDNETRYNLSTNSNRIISDFNNTINNSDDSFDDDSVISFLNLIVNQVNLMLFNINRMDVNNFQVINNLYNEFYHKICQLVNTTINKYRQSYKLLKKLINNLIVTTIKMSYEQSINSYEKLSTTTVISTINNILGSNDSEVIRDLVNILIDDNESSFVDDNIYVPWMSYLIYLYFNLNKNDRYNNNEENEVDNNDIIQQILYTRHNIITSILNSSVKSISILYNIIWIHLIMVFDPVNNFGIEIDRFKGYNFNDILFNNKKLSYKINYELANEMYGFLYYYIENNNKFIINFDLDFFNNINSENRILFVELNQLLYSLLSSIVFYNHQQIEPNNNLNSNEFNRINTRTDISFINFIRSAILKIMNINKVGGYNIHIYGLLNTIFDNKLDAIFKSYELSHNIWDNVESIYINNNYYLQIVSKLMSLQNSFFSSLKLKVCILILHKY